MAKHYNTVARIVASGTSWYCALTFACFWNILLTWSNLSNNLFCYVVVHFVFVGIVVQCLLVALSMPWWSAWITPKVHKGNYSGPSSL